MMKGPCPIAQFDWRACAGRFLLSHGFVMQSPPMPIGQVQDYLEAFGREMLSAIVQEKEHFKKLAQDAINRMPSATYERAASLPVGESTREEIAGRCPACSTLLISPSNDGRTAEGAATEQSVLMGRPASAINSWTSVSEKLPEEMERVWLWVKTSSGPQTEEGGYAVEGRRLNLPDGHPTWVHNDGDTLVESGSYGRVTHWQPLPKPPEVGLGESREPLPCEHTFVQNYGNTRRACSKCGRFEELTENGFRSPE